MSEIPIKVWVRDLDQIKALYANYTYLAFRFEFPVEMDKYAGAEILVIKKSTGDPEIELAYPYFLVNPNAGFKGDFREEWLIFPEEIMRQLDGVF